jgi:hypothetical protein
VANLLKSTKAAEAADVAATAAKEAASAGLSVSQMCPTCGRHPKLIREDASSLCQSCPTARARRVADNNRRLVSVKLEEAQEAAEERQRHQKRVAGNARWLKRVKQEEGMEAADARRQFEKRSRTNCDDGEGGARSKRKRADERGGGGGSAQ